MRAATLPRELTERQALDEAEARIRCLFRRFGLDEPQGLEILVHDCMQRVRQRAQDHEDLPRRAVEEAGRRYDIWLQRGLELSPGLGLQELARARAALLFAPLQGAADGLVPGKGLTPSMREALRAALPQPVPPAAPIAIPTQAIAFASFSRRHRTESPA